MIPIFALMATSLVYCVDTSAFGSSRMFAFSSPWGSDHIINQKKIIKPMKMCIYQKRYELINERFHEWLLGLV